MLGYTTRHLGRIAGQSVLVKELGAGLRAAGGSGKTQLCAVITASCLSSEAVSQAKPGTSAVNATSCGFPKEFIRGPSCVLDHGVFGEDACFIARYKSTHVAGKFDSFFLYLLNIF
uniref:Protein phosphatase n=1 Tax=Panagrolaimus sp. JU765 TaxID=591449 RepID=A0AC34RI94_9BILA